MKNPGYSYIGSKLLETVKGPVVNILNRYLKNIWT